MKRPSSIRRVLALSLIAALLAGCSQHPTAPADPASTAGAARVAPQFDEPEPAPSPVSPSPVSKSAESTRRISALLGGTVSAGQFRVIIPPGALRASASITVKQPDLTRREVELEVTPASANGFLVPVLLVADCSGMTPRLLSLQTIYWWNPEAARWEAVLGAQVNLLGKSVSVPLWHFSRYKVDGKAGW